MTAHRDMYSSTDLQIMQQAEAIRKMGLSRVEEIIEFARKAGLQRIGIANCLRYRREAGVLEERLVKAGFEVASVHCKYGLVPASELIEEGRGTVCNPAGQAEFLAARNTQLNVVMGLCLGHDMVFTAHTKVPSTTMNVKDRQHGDSPLKGLLKSN